MPIQKIFRGAGRSARRSTLAALAAAASLLVPTLFGPMAALAVVDFYEHRHQLADLDAREGKVLPTAAQLKIVEGLGASVEWNAFGTPQSLINYRGPLAAGLAGDAVAVARQFISDNRALFRLSDAGLDKLELLNDQRMAGYDGHSVLFRQRFGELPAGQDGMIAVGVVGDKVYYVSSSCAGDQPAPGPALLTPAQAWLKAAADLGRAAALADVTGTGEDGSWTTLAVAGFSDPQRVRLVALPTPKNGVRPAYECLTINVKGGELTGWLHFVDAQSGAVLFRQNRVQQFAQAGVPYPPRWRVFPANPSHDLSGADSRVLWCWVNAVRGVPVAGCQMELQNIASRAPWDHDVRLDAPTFTTKGNNASTGSAWVAPLGTGEQYRPAAPTRDYSFPWTNQWFTMKGSEAALATPQRADVDAAIANLFAMHNRMHDWQYTLGFTENNYNLQDSNFGNRGTGTVANVTGGERDPEIGNAQAGALDGAQPDYLGRNNANQLTQNDGVPGVTNMYLWVPIANIGYPNIVDGDFDMSVIGHEYTHATSNRMAGGPDSSLSGHQAGAMGESWSDLVAVEYLNEYGLVPTDGENPFSVGAYVTGNKVSGIRNFPMNNSPLNYSNVGYDTAGPQVHADGEIWSATNFDIRRALVEKYDSQFPASDLAAQRECADGERPVAQCPGNRRWIQLVFDAWLLMPGSVSMLGARDAYLAADMMRFGGANQTELWRAFAGRGMGQGAHSNGAGDTAPIPSFASPVEANGVVTFRVAAGDEGGAPVSARIFVGHFEARSRHVADTNPATTANNPPTANDRTQNNDETASILPGTYDFIVQAAGHGSARFRRTIRPGTQRLLITLPTNWASRSKGATAAGDGVNATNRLHLIDDTEATNWASLGNQNTPNTVEGRNVIINLGGDEPRLVSRVQASALSRPFNTADPGGDTGSQLRLAAMRRFKVLTCTAGPGNDCSNPNSGFTEIFDSTRDAFPGYPFRPTSPKLIMREFDVPDTAATHVQMRVVENQCTGEPAYQGTLDADPTNPTDCVSEGPPPGIFVVPTVQGDGPVPNVPMLIPQSRNVRATEFQVFSGAAAVTEEPTGERVNVALALNGAAATASSTYPSGDYSASSAIDGDRRGLNWGAGGGWADATRDLYPDWLEVSFGGPRRVDEVRVYTLQDGYLGGAEPTASTPATLYGLLDYQVQYWDGGNWVTLGGVTGNGLAVRTFNFPEVTTTKIRVLVGSARSYFSRVVEVEAYGFMQ